MAEDDDSAMMVVDGADKEVTFVNEVPLDAKLIQLLRNLTSTQSKLSLDASKEFTKLLKSDSGPRILSSYIQSSQKCTEFLKAWELQKGKPEFFQFLNLVSAVLGHPFDKVSSNNLFISSALDKFARVIVVEKMEDLYIELNSKEAKRQKAVLLLLASIVRRGLGLAWDVIKHFDFKTANFTRLSEWKLRQNEDKMKGRRNKERRKGRQNEDKRKYLTRKELVGFAMSFLEVANPRLLREILQQKDMYSGVLRALGADDEEIVVYVLSTVRDRVLVPESLVPPSLRSVLFGSATLEQLINISGGEDGGVAAEVAHSVLLKVCTDPSNGLMPDLERKPSPLRGNLKRLFDLMKKLKPTMVDYHKDLLLAMVKGKPAFGSAYLNEFPYNVEDLTSSTWSSAVYLAADVLSSVGDGLTFEFVDSQSQEPPSFDSSVVQDVVKCITPRPFTQSMTSKGLQHPDPLVKHGALSLVLMELKLLDTLVGAPINASRSFGQATDKWSSLRQDIQNAVCIMLPNPQVLYNLLVSLGYGKKPESGAKRIADTNVDFEIKRKKSKISTAIEDNDAGWNGIHLPPGDDRLPPDNDINELCNGVQVLNAVHEIRGLQNCSTKEAAVKNGKSLLCSKLLDALKIYHRTLPTAFEGSFTFFKLLPAPPNISTIELQSLLCLLVDQVVEIRQHVISFKTQPGMYEHLNLFINLFIYSRRQDIRDWAYTLVQAAMFSTGAFDINPREIGTWLLFLPRYNKNYFHVHEEEIGVFKKLATFLCKAASSTKNNLFNDLDLLRGYASSEGSTEFGPFIVRILEECLDFLGDESHLLPEKSMISLYVSTTLKYFLETQVEAGLLSTVICHVLSGKLKCSCKIEQLSCSNCEWSPLHSLFCFASRIQEGLEIFGTYGVEGNIVASGDLFPDVLCEVQGILRSENVDLFNLWPEVYYAGVKAGGTTIITDKLVDSEESFSAAFGSFVKVAPFHTMFPSILFIDDSISLDHSKVRKLLVDKFSVMKPEHSVSAFCHILFCLLQARMAYRNKPVLEKVCESSYFLAEHILKQLLIERTGSDSSSSLPSQTSTCYIQEVTEVMFSHPLVTSYLEDHMAAATNSGHENFSRPLGNFLNMTEMEISKVDHVTLSLLRRTCELLVNLPYNSVSQSEVDRTGRRLPRAFNVLVQRLIFTLKKGFPDGMEMTRRLFHPILYALNDLKEFISPFDILELADWIFSQSDRDGTSGCDSTKNHFSVGLQVASCAFDSLRMYMLSSKVKNSLFDPFVGVSSSTHDVSLFEKIFFCICDIATREDDDFAYHCLLKAAKVVKYHSNVGKISLQFTMASSRLLSCIPLSFFSHLLNNITTTKVELLFILSEMSSLHLFEFGHLVSDILSENARFEDNMKEANHNSPPDFDKLFLLLPTILLYIDSALLKFGGELHPNLKNVTCFIWKILLQGLSNWKTFVLKDIFAVKPVECSPSSMEELFNLFSSSLLGKAVLLMQYYLSACGHLVETKERLSLFDDICQHTSASAVFLENLSFSSVELLLNSANRIVANIRFCRVLLFPEHCQLQSKLEDGGTINIESEFNSSRSRFLTVLVRLWIRIIEFHENLDDSGQGRDMNAIFRFLEGFFAENILDLIGSLPDCLSLWDSFPFEQLVNTFFLHRFEDPCTLKMLRSILNLLPKGKFPCIPIFHRLLDDPRLSSTILFDHKASSSQMSVSSADTIRTMKSFAFPWAAENTNGKANYQTFRPYMKKLEVVKLLRILVHITSQQGSSNFGTSTERKVRELVLQLLSSYGATMNEIDLEIYNLMNEIESVDQAHSECIAKWDYLWGSTAMNISKELEQVQGLSSNLQDDEVIEEQRRTRFRENLPIDPKLCSRTVLCFPYDRSVVNRTLIDIDTDSYSQKHCPSFEKIHVYDPVFILRFGIHGLAMEYIEPLEFASLGLLAISFMALSSSDAEIRKLAYEAIVRFKGALERCQKRKDVMRLRLLLSYLQNGIEEECQRIPSITAVFVAEASFILLDSSHDLYSSISKALMRSSGTNTKGIPLFQEFFESCSVNFKIERLWMLRLLNSALDRDADAQIFIRNSTLEILLNFYTSPLSDVESKDLILQMIKKSARIQEVERYFLCCGMIPWLSSLVASFHGMLLEDQKRFPFDKLAAVLEVANDVISSVSLSKWLEEYALEPLAEFAAQLHRVLVGTKFTQLPRITDLILQVLQTTLKISQERTEDQPQFNLSFEGLYKLYEAVDKCCGSKFCSTAEIGLKCILLSTPPVSIFDMDQHKLREFVSWAMSTALQSHFMEVTDSELKWRQSSKISEEELEEDLLSKLLRWLAASVIIERLKRKLIGSNSISTSRLELNTLDALLEGCENGLGSENDLICKRILGEAIFYLQQLSIRKWKLLPSVVSALCLLLFPGGPSSVDTLLGKDWISVATLLQKVKSPPEADPAWRWSFDRPWRDVSTLGRSAGEKLEEIHSCQKLLVVISKILGQKSLSTHGLSLQEVEKSKVFDWERSIHDPKK